MPCGITEFDKKYLGRDFPESFPEIGETLVVTLEWFDPGLHASRGGMAGIANHIFETAVIARGINSSSVLYLILGTPGAPFTKPLVLYYAQICENGMYHWILGRECNSFLFEHEKADCNYPCVRLFVRSGLIR